MSEQIKRWIPIALYCAPRVAIAAIVSIGIVFGGAVFSASPLGSGSLGIGLIALAALACPLSMGLMMRGMKQNSATGSAQKMMDCCAPGQVSVFVDTSLSADSLSELRSRREALEREIAELQSN